MILDFADRGSADIFHGVASKDARRTLPRELWAVAQRKLDRLNRARELRDLRDPPGNRLEELKGKRAGTYSMRINDQYRITFAFELGDATAVRIEDHH